MVEHKIHIRYGGKWALCDTKGLHPTKWGEGHVWVPGEDWRNSNCSTCVQQYCAIQMKLAQDTICPELEELKPEPVPYGHTFKGPG